MKDLFQRSFLHRAKIDILEDRMSPGNTGIGSLLSLSFLDPPISAGEFVAVAPSRIAHVIEIDQGDVTVSSPAGQAVYGGSVINRSYGTYGVQADAERLANPVVSGPQSTRAAAPSLNEIRRDQIGTDNDEYFELVGDAGGSLSGYTYIVIGDGTGGSGVIEAVVDLSGNSLNGSGYFVAAESTFTLGSANLTTNLNFENTDNVTHMLVSGFTGTEGQDLDTDDDGTLDIVPWSSVDDCLSLIGPGTGDQIYCTTRVGPEGPFHPGHVFKCDDPSNWAIGPFDPADGNDTPGSANPDSTQCRLVKDPLGGDPTPTPTKVSF